MLHPSDADLAYMRAHADDNRVPLFVGVNAMCVGVVCVAIFLRFTSRMKIRTKIGLDDWLIALAALLVTAHVSCLMIAVHYGMGRHAIFVTDVRAFSIIMLVAQTCYNLCIATVKLSILCLYARIFQRTHGWFRPTLYVAGIFVFLYTIPQCFVYILQCVPISSLWTEYGPGYEVICINFKAAIIVFGVINIVTDWFILLLPIPIVLGLRLDSRKKWSICSLFLIGFAVCVISIIRLFYAKQVETVDPSWDYMCISAISTTECATGILAACMPTWRPLFKSLCGKITSYVRTGSARSQSDPERSLNAATKGANDGAIRGSWRWSSKSCASRKAPGDVKIEHHSMGTGMLGAFPKSLSHATSNTAPKTGKRSESSMSGSSFENILRANRDYAHTEETSLEMMYVDQDISDKGSSSLSSSPSLPPALHLAAAATTLSPQSPPESEIPLPAGTGMQASIGWPSLPAAHLTGPPHDPSQPKDKKTLPFFHRKPAPDSWDAYASIEQTTEPGVKWEAKAQSDRWDALMKQQTIRNERDERDASPNARGLKQKQKNKGSSFGDIAYGGRVVNLEFGEGGPGEEGGRKTDRDRDSAEQKGKQGRGSGGAGAFGGVFGEGIVVTKTVDRVEEGMTGGAESPERRF